MHLKMIEIGTLLFQKKTEFHSCYPVDNIINVNVQSNNIHHTLHLQGVPLNTVFALPLISTQQHNQNPHFHFPYPPCTSPFHHTHMKTSKKISLITLFGVLKYRYLIPPKYIYYLPNISQIII